MASLRIEFHGQTVTARLEGHVIRIGRDTECDLTVDDPTVAAIHVTIEPFGNGGHKLTEEVIVFIVETRAASPEMSVGQLVDSVRKRFGLSVHPRSVERALERRAKKAS